MTYSPILPDPTIDHPASPIEVEEEQCTVCGYIGYTIEQSYCEVSNEWYPSKELMRCVDGEWVCVECIKK